MKEVLFFILLLCNCNIFMGYKRTIPHLLSVKESFIWLDFGQELKLIKIKYSQALLRIKYDL